MHRAADLPTSDRLAGRWPIMIELQATDFVLKSWNQNPAATKRQIGIWQHWKEQAEDNDRPLAEVEVERMKAFLSIAQPDSHRWLRGVGRGNPHCVPASAPSTLLGAQDAQHFRESERRAITMR